MMEHRVGVKGGFWYCRVHGTVSDKGMQVVERLREAAETLHHLQIFPYASSSSQDPLQRELEKQMMPWGGWTGGERRLEADEAVIGKDWGEEEGWEEDEYDPT